jgi:hypothetical protein
MWQTKLSQWLTNSPSGGCDKGDCKMAITNLDQLREDDGWTPTIRLRVVGETLQQRWDNYSNGKSEWRDVPVFPDPTDRG